MNDEAQRSPRMSPFISPVNPDIQKVLDKVNKVLVSSGYALQPTTNIKKDTPRVARFFIRRYAKYLVPSFYLRAIPKPKAPVKGKKSKK